MKRLLVIVMALGMMIGMMGINTAMADEGGNSANKVCKWTAENMPGLFDYLYDSHGDCVSGKFLIGRSNSDEVSLCKVWAENGSLPILGTYEFENQGQCVSTLGQIFN